MKNQVINTTNIRSIFIPYVGTETIALHLRGKAGSICEKPAEVGAAHMVEHLSADNAYSTVLSKNGSKAYGVTSRDSVLYLVLALKENIEDAVAYLGECYKAKRFSKTKIDFHRELIKNEIKRYAGVPEKLIGRRSYELMFPNSRLKFLNSGNLDQIEALTLKTVSDFKAKNYINSNFVIAASGNINNDVLCKLINKYFPTMRNAPKIDSSQPFPEYDLSFKQQNIVIPSSQLSHVKFDFPAYRISDDRKYANLLLARMLGNHLAVEFKNPPLSCYKTSVVSLSGGYFGLFSIYTAQSNAQAQQAIDQVHKGISNFSKYITPASLESAKKQAIAEFLFNFEKPSVRADYYSELLLFGTKKQTHNYELKKINECSTEELTLELKRIQNYLPKITVISNINN
ncbi:hypothetical protein A3K34_01750 [candidate division WWE3 bacterium RIFOXYC1_FULL_40_10]|uniref:Peptidase M16 C-terminal domain-containing protein n=1 Tax=candidate division WWE3 bacterium RIFOXYA2_FULL_46_9 TaxID=1802636 RepID=A0A1F4W2I8_UNCKA|nr:MAG: hypothetical protein A3K58_01750 [candidate division WWE3 bacterium RIFOXYB1_FULL_40_22]OGC61587.1 MAG: hypothetical protein A3K37_01750 [candidate division WWE3 bacterium RIFOXYA1_FULL_40_11]OGC63634.1 MAG: hypothetical protein A2264_04695 [candidate division WWE3 bacterium RIFOXYA2_FULL_46_9]OGC64735.1 MAG: hypothetical protein A2326_01700 [candidate division WWE3 bacterium RIFOXYB2_FULL_41_6]OGC65970.1 MAG: hypothetical protein A3K34_01750 [candidate division WWE3 bacterium RIFOXYC1_